MIRIKALIQSLLSMLTTGCLTCPCLASALEPALSESKSDSLHFLEGLRSDNVHHLTEIDAKLRRAEGGSSLSRDERVHLTAAQHEYQQRQEFLNRLILKIDKNFSGGDLRAFLERALTDMTKVDPTATPADHGLIRFVTYAADAVHHLPEKSEHILWFLEGYMNRSITNPVPPKDYLAMRNYSNGGSKFESGSPMNASEAGAFADARLQQLSGLNTVQPAVIQQRAR